MKARTASLSGNSGTRRRYVAFTVRPSRSSTGYEEDAPEDVELPDDPVLEPELLEPELLEPELLEPELLAVEVLDDDEVLELLDDDELPEPELPLPPERESVR